MIRQERLSRGDGEKIGNDEDARRIQFGDEEMYNVLNSGSELLMDLEDNERRYSLIQEWHNFDEVCRLQIQERWTNRMFFAFLFSLERLAMLNRKFESATC